MFNYIVMDKAEMQEFMAKNTYQQEYKDNGSQVYVGFHYFKSESVYPNGLPSRWTVSADEFFFVTLIDKRIIGVMRLIQNVESPLYELTIDFIDVHNEFRRQGIAKGIYNMVNEWALNKPNTVIVGTRLSVGGKQSNLHKIRTDIIKNCHCFTTREQIIDHKKTLVH
jgi:GNAT superfamily N-acetyltransferase